MQGLRIVPHDELKVVTPCQRSPRIFWSADLAEQKAAKEMCKHCPFRPACLAKAFRVEAVGGIWGGYDEVERSFYAKLFGTKVERVVRPLPPALVRRLEANKVMKTGRDADLVVMEA